MKKKKKATEEDSKEKVTVGLKIRGGWEGGCLYANGYALLIPIGPSGRYLASRLATSL